MTSTQAALRNLDVRLALEDPSGRLAWGSPVVDADRATTTFRETDLPWTIHVALADPAAAQAISMSRRNVFVAGFGVMLLVLSAFVRRSGRLLTRAQLLDDVWGPGTNVTDRVVDNQVTNLRKKIEPDPEHPRFLVALRGLGYRFDGEGVTEP